MNPISFEGRTLAIFGCGYVGLAVAQWAVSSGLRVIALTRNAGQASVLRERGVHQVLAAELDSNSWHSRIDPRVEYILTTVGSAGGGLSGYRKSYLNGQRSIFRWLGKARPLAYIYTSSTSVYPQTQGEQVHEETATEGVGKAGRMLLEAESLVRSHCRRFGSWFILRLAGIYGPGRHHYIDRLRRGETAFSGSPDTYLNLIHRDDAASAIAMLIQRAGTVPSGTYNLTDGHAATRGEVVSWLAHALSASRPSLSVDPSPHGGHCKSPRIARSANRVVDNRRLRKALGWGPRFASYREGYEAILRPHSA